MWQFTEVANWFDGKRGRADAILDEWVEDSQYHQGVMVVAATTKSFMTVGAGFVDLLRLGDGVRQRTLSGVGQDGLRLFAILPIGKASQLWQSVKGLRLAKVVVDVGGPNCFWVASAKALAQISHKTSAGKIFASVDDLAKSLGMNVSRLWEIPNLSAGIAYLKQLGAQVGAVRRIAAARDIERMVPFNGSVVMVAVHVVRAGQIVGGHAIYAFRTSFGQIRYMDRTVRQVGQRLYQSIDEIGPMYHATLVPYEAALIHNVFVKSVLHEAPRLLIPVVGVIATASGENK